MSNLYKTLLSCLQIIFFLLNASRINLASFLCQPFFYHSCDRRWYARRCVAHAIPITIKINGFFGFLPRKSKPIGGDVHWITPSFLCLILPHSFFFLYKISHVIRVLRESEKKIVKNLSVDNIIRVNICGKVLLLLEIETLAFSFFFFLAHVYMSL